MDDEPKHDVFEPYLKAMLTATHARVFFTSKEDYFGLEPVGIEPQDQICVHLGCRTPIVLRPSGSGSTK